MPSVAIKYIVSFSSQDGKHPVTNLIKGDGFNKWLCCPKERSGHAEAVFQLEGPCVISYIDIGSIWCANIEIKVGRSDWPTDREFETLAFTVNLMTPSDCLTNKNPNKTQMFSTEMFCPEVAKKAWDRIKVICRQPYKKSVQFGLSFLRVKTASVVQNTTSVAKQPAVSKASSVTDIQKHFLEKLDNGVNKSNGQLKSRLLKIAASSDCGASEHDNSLSRTAKLVLAASGNKSKTYGNQTSVPLPEKIGMYSSTLEQKYGPEFGEEVDTFLKELKLDPTELDSITMADVRHRFERKKRRKLTKEEKKIFIAKTTEHLTTVFKDKTNLLDGKENNKQKHASSIVEKSGTSESSSVQKKMNDLAKENQVKMEKNSVEVQKNSLDPVVNKKFGIKRKLENDIATPPSKKLAAASKSPQTLMQKMKSTEKSSPNSFERKDLIGQFKKSPANGPVRNCVSSPAGTPFQYKGLRGRELDLDSQLPDTSTPARPTNSEVGYDCQPQEKWLNASKPDCQTLSPIGKVSRPSGDLSKDLICQVDSSSDDDCFAEISVKAAKGRGKQGRGRTPRSTRRGRGRGRGKQSVTTANFGQDELDLFSGDLGSPEVRGRGRGRRRGRGNRQGKNVPSPPRTHTSTLSGPEEMKAPRGFEKCSGCGDFFGETYMGAHHLRCAAYKAKQNSDKATGAEPTETGYSTPNPTRTSTSNLEIRPTGFVKCDGCYEYYGDNLLAIHQQKCQRWKGLQKSSSNLQDSPWLSEQSPIGQSCLNSANQKASCNGPGYRLGSGCETVNEISSSIQAVNKRSESEPVRSPPWLLAAEKRLQQQKSDISPDTVSSSPFSDAVDTFRTINRTSLKKSSSDCSGGPSPVQAQQWMLEKYERKKMV